MDAQSTDIGSSFAADPKDSHVTVFIVLNELGLIDGSGDITASKIGCRYRHLRDQQFENAMPSFYEIDFKFLPSLA